MPVNQKQYGDELALEAYCDAEGCGRGHAIRWTEGNPTTITSEMMEGARLQLHRSGWEMELHDGGIAFCPDHSALGSIHSS